MQKYTVIKGHISNFPDPIILKKEQEVLYGKEDKQFPNWIFCIYLSTNLIQHPIMPSSNVALE
ncbi:hypothetical protein [Mesobacillus zeae]|uniref:hypothetical protein n=1 Tax=Mesobacillus zeae TaxID=1917180 RepID=UPI0015E6C439|nr:hypothetical protein [Mesobacillus zeae]